MPGGVALKNPDPLANRNRHFHHLYQFARNENAPSRVRNTAYVGSAC